MKGKIMKLRTIFYGLTSGLLLGLSSCSLNYEPLDTYSDVTEGVMVQKSYSRIKLQLKVI